MNVDSCRLMSINLLNYVTNPYTKRADIDWNRLSMDAFYAQRFMDDMVDLEIEKIDKILEKIEQDEQPEDLKRVEKELWLKMKKSGLDFRRTGLGVTAEGDMLAAVGLRYGSEEAIIISEGVHQVIAGASYKSSIIMAKERGAFRRYNVNNDRNVPLLKRLFYLEAVGGLDVNEFTIMAVHGRRNVANLTIAPNGSISILTQTTSGIEPLFKPYYKRRVKTTDPDRIKFVDEVGDGWDEFFVVHKGLERWMEVNKKSYSNEEELEELFKQSPYYGSTSDDVDYLAKVEMQGRIQKYVDHSINVCAPV